MESVALRCSSCGKPIQSRIAKLPCNHFLCALCYSMSGKQNSIHCPCCSKVYYNQNYLTQILERPETMKQKQNGLYELMKFKIESEIKSLTSMKDKVSEAYNELNNLFYQYNVFVNQSFFQLTKMIEQIQESVQAKLQEHKNMNEYKLNEQLYTLNKHLEKRNNIIQLIANTNNCSEVSTDFNIKIEISSLEAFYPVELTLNEFSFAYDISDIWRSIGEYIVNQVQFPTKIIKIYPEPQSEYGEYSVNQIEPPDNNLKFSPEPQSEYVEGVNNNNFTNDPLKNDEQACEVNEFKKVDEAESAESVQSNKEKIKIAAREYTIPRIVNQSENEHVKDEKPFSQKDDPRCEWFIMVREELKPLPDFVCKQIHAYKSRKSEIFIKNEGRRVNIVNLSSMLYHTLDKYGHINPSKTHQLINIPR